jgi:hypothetical protein
MRIEEVLDRVENRGKLCIGGEYCEKRMNLEISCSLSFLN